MRAKISNIFIIVLSFLILFMLISRNHLIYSSIHYGLDIWVNNLIPTLFPFFIISDILINYNIVEYIPNFIKDIFKKIFNITDNMLIILLFSMISGFPSNARNTRTMYDMRVIDINEANHIMIFSHFANPLFIFSTVGISFFNNKVIGTILLITHYLSNFILGIIIRNSFKHDKHNYVNKINKHDFGSIFIASIKKAIDTILLICGIVCIFMVLSTIIDDLFNFNDYNSMIIRGLFEMTIGIKSLSILNLSVRYKAIITSIFLAFGGLSVHMQVFSQIADTKISYFQYFIGRIWQMIIAGFLTYIICVIYNI